MDSFNLQDQEFMHQAILLAEQAANNGEVPVGAVVVLANQIIGRGYNQPISSHDPTAHAEIIALRQAANNIKNYRLVDTTMYVTLEPCAMCKAALLHARISRLVFAASDPKAPHAYPYNHQIKTEHGLLGQQCAKLLQDFFKQRR